MRPSFSGPLAAAILTSAAAWLAQATVALTGTGVERVALLPLSMPVAAVAAGAGAAAGLLRWRGASAAPLALLLPVVLPWLPLPVPSAFLIWAGPLAGLAVAAALAVMAASTGPRLPSVSRPVLAAGLLAFLIDGAAAWRVAPMVPGGDEPHYLIITQSLLRDHDLQIENNHRRGDYRAYFGGDLPKPDYYRRGRNGAIYSVHAPGLPALAAPAFALAGYRGVEVFLLLIAGAGAALVWWLARRVTGRDDAAWFGWGSVVLAAPLLLNSFTVYPDGVGGVLVLTGVWALVRLRGDRESGRADLMPWFLHGLALALLPWLHTRFALLAGGVGALVLLGLAKTRNPAGKACAFLLVPTISAVAWLAFFMAIYGTPDPAIPYRGSDLGSPAYIPGGLGGLFFDQMYGLFAVAPVLIAMPAGLAVLTRRPGPFRLLPLELAFVGGPYGLTVTHFAMWWGGFSSPARFLVALLPAMAIPAAAAWAAAARRGTRALLLVLLGGSASISAALTLVDRGRLAYFGREHVFAPWTAWVSRLADLGHAAPAFFARVDRGRPGSLFFVESAVWVLALVLAWLALRRLGDSARVGSRGRLATVAVVVLIVAASGAATAVWSIEGVSGRSAGRSALELLRAAGDRPRAIGIDISAARLVDREALPRHLSLAFDIEPRPAGSRGGASVLALPQVPAGVYGLRLEPRTGGGVVVTGLGTDQFALVTEPAARYDGTPELRLPVDVRALVVKADDEAGSGLRTFVLEPRRVFGPGEKVSGLARRAVKYDAGDVFFLDDRAFPEPGGFWIGGSRTASVVVQPTARRPSVVLRVRNGPIENRVVLRSGAWEDALALTPGQEVDVPVPIDSSRGAAAIEVAVASGFRPADVDAGSRDTRLLGVWVELRI